VPDVQFICTEEAQLSDQGKHHNTSRLKVSSGVALKEFVLNMDGDCTY